MTSKISTDTLFHYTSPDACKSILACGGFRYCRKIEAVPHPQYPYTQTNYVVCFCDLPSTDSPHLRKSRPVGIGLKKAWGIKNQVTPVRYVHANSVGSGNTYRTLNNLRRMEERLPEPYGSDHGYLQMLLAAALRELSEQHPDGNTIDPGKLEFEHSKLERNMQELVTIANGTLPQDEAMRQTFSALMWAIRLLHNELEDRDSYMRSYEESKDGQTIRNYDEREWRALSRHGFAGDQMIDPNSEGKWLRPECNLTFKDSDILEIIVPDETHQNAVQSFLKNFGRTSLSDRTRVVPIF